MEMEQDLWTFSDVLEADMELEGFDVAALDGDIGSIGEATYEVGSAYVVVDTGPWIFGKKVLIPASAIVRIDLERRKAFLRLTKQQIKDSPELSDVDETKAKDRDRVATYYDSLF